MGPRVKVCNIPFGSKEPLIDILYEDEELLVVNKPAGLVCHPTKGDCLSSLIARVRIYLGCCPLRQGVKDCIYRSSGECPWDSVEFIDPLLSVNFINRLDRETSGVMLITKTQEAARIYGKIMREGRIKKSYQAIVKGIPEPKAGLIERPLGADENSTVVVKDCVREDGYPSETVYRLVKSFERDGNVYSLLNVFPGTGRKHQIRIHLSWMGCPIVGDKLYGESPEYYLAFVENRLSEEQRQKLILPYHALHAKSLSFTTFSGKEYYFECPPEKWFREFAMF